MDNPKSQPFSGRRKFLTQPLNRHRKFLDNIHLSNTIMTKYFLIFFILLPFLGQTQIVKQNIHTNNRMKIGIDSIVQKSVTLFMSDTSKVGLSAGVYKNGTIYSYNYGSSLKVKPKLPTNNTI